MGAKGCMSLWGNDPDAHKLFADHCASEIPQVVTTKGRVVTEWKEKVGIDNDFWDCIVGCCVGASVQGVSLIEQKPPSARRVVRVSELMKQRKHHAVRSA